MWKRKRIRKLEREERMREQDMLTSSVTMLGLRCPADMQSVASTSSPTTTTLIILLVLSL